MDTRFKPNKKIINVWFIMWFVAFFFFYLVPIVPLIYFSQFLAALIVTVVILPWFLIASFWIPKFYQSIQYNILDDHIRIESGVWWQQVKTIPFKMITDIKILQGPLARFFQFGNLMIQTAGMGAQNTSEGKLLGLIDYKQKQNDLLQRIQYTSPPAKKQSLQQKQYMGNEEQLLNNILKELRDIKNKMNKTQK